MATPSRTDRSRTLILDAADAAFRQVGFADTSMEEIASRAGLTRKTVYNLFSSKEDIGLQVIARVEAQDAGYRARIAANHDAIDLLGIVLLDSARWCLANPTLARLALDPAKRPSLDPPSRPSFQQLVRDILLLGQQQGTIRTDDDANFLALVLLAVYGQAMLTALSTGTFDASDIRRIIRIIVEGMGAA